MSCNNCCQNVLKVVDAQSCDNTYCLFVDKTPTLKNGCKFILVIPCEYTTNITEIHPVTLKIGDEIYEITDRTLGNVINTDQLRFICTNNCHNRVARLVYGDNPAHFKLISQCLPQSMEI